MTETYFLFGGRLNRLQYFLAGLVINLIGGGLLFLAIMEMVNGGGMLILAFLIVFGLMFLWVSLSMQAARIRDIGLNPLFTIVGFAIVYGIVHSLETMTLGSDLGSILSMFDIGLQIVATLFMLLAPGDSFSGDDPILPAAPLERLDRGTVLTREETKVRTHPAATAPMARGYGKPTFGRRGI